MLKSYFSHLLQMQPWQGTQIPCHSFATTLQAVVSFLALINFLMLAAAVQ
ncbi:hypothetical protein ACFQDF_12885 [Ectobacillus funiculus]